MTTDITELAQREKFEAWFVNDVVGAEVTFPGMEDGEYVEGEIYDDQLYFVLQAMWMAWKSCAAEMVEALEKAQRYIEELREWNVGLAQESRERQQRIVELENQLKAAENNEIDARCRIAELEESHAQVIQSRDHYKRMSEEGLKQLADSRTVTVKLPKDHVDDADLFGWGVVVVPLEALKEACADAGVTVEIADAGIKWEAE